MRKVTIRITDRQYEKLEMLVRAGEFPSVSEAIRSAIREFIDSNKEKIEKFESLQLYS